MADLQALAARIRALIMDVDGVLTDGGLYFASDGTRMLRFDVKDGLGIGLLRQDGVVCALVTCGVNPVVEHRAEVLKIEHVVMGCPEDAKGEAVRKLLPELGVSSDEAAYIGDDLTDIAAFREVGLPIAPQDAAPEVREAALWVTSAPGGRGAVREVAELILRARRAQRE